MCHRSNLELRSKERDVFEAERFKNFGAEAQQVAKSLGKSVHTRHVAKDVISVVQSSRENS